MVAFEVWLVTYYSVCPEMMAFYKAKGEDATQGLRLQISSRRVHPGNALHIDLEGMQQVHACDM